MRACVERIRRRASRDRREPADDADRAPPSTSARAAALVRLKGERGGRTGVCARMRASVCAQMRAGVYACGDGGVHGAGGAITRAAWGWAGHMVVLAGGGEPRRARRPGRPEAQALAQLLPPHHHPPPPHLQMGEGRAWWGAAQGAAPRRGCGRAAAGRPWPLRMPSVSCIFTFCMRRVNVTTAYLASAYTRLNAHMPTRAHNSGR
jgi:hypothetical protein